MTEIDSFEYWMGQLSSRAPNTIKMYRTYFKKFCDYMKATPNALIEMQAQGMQHVGDPRENKIVENKVKLWIGELQKTKAPATARMALNAVKSFFELNEHPLRLRNFKIEGESVGSRIPEKEEVILFADAAKWKYRAAIMFLKDSGLRLSDVVRIRWEQKVDMGDGFWNFNLMTQKRKVAACAFVGPETTRLLDQFKSKTGRIFNTTVKNMSKVISRIITVAKVEGVTAHGLRKYFTTSMQHARVPSDFYLHMMGKKVSVYSENRRSELFQAYRKAYPDLSIYALREQEEIIANQAKEIEKLKKEMDTKVYGFGEELQQFKKKMENGLKEAQKKDREEYRKYAREWAVGFAEKFANKLILKGLVDKNEVLKAYNETVKEEGKKS